MTNASTIVGLAFERATRSPGGPAISDDDTRLDNRQFADAVAAAAAALREEGVGRGDIVALLLPNSVDFVVAMFAAWQIGAAITPINPALTAQEIYYQLTDAAALLIVTIPSVARKLNYDRPRIDDLLQRSAAAGSTLDPDEPGSDKPGPDDPALVIYTSGSTGRPKGVVLTHANTLAMATIIRSALELDDSTVGLLILPLFHVNAIMVSTLAPLLAGGSTHVARRFDAATFFDSVREIRPTYFSAVPTVYAKLLAIEPPRPHSLDSLKFALCGAAPASVELLRAAKALLGVPVLEGYGLSEGSCVSTINPLRGEHRAGTVGLPLPGQTIRIVAADGTHADAGELGEVTISGPNVMAGYLGRPEETAHTVVDGWLLTGDVGRFDDAGYLVLVDRLKDMIIRGGENIYPKEIENAVHAIPGVTAAAVVGRPDAVFGEVPVLFMTVDATFGLDTDGILSRLTEHISRFKLPVQIYIVDEIPTNSVGKFDKPALRKRLLEDAHR